LSINKEEEDNIEKIPNSPPESQDNPQILPKDLENPQHPITQNYSKITSNEENSIKIDD
jgi:hypothetical protein